MSGDTTVEEQRVGVVDGLREDEALVLDTRSERVLLSLVARAELRGVRDGVHVRAPVELDRVTN